MSGAFIAIGHIPQSAIVEGLVKTDENGSFVTEGKSTRPGVPDVFAAGDVVDHTYGRRSPPRAPAVWRRDAEWYLRDNPALPRPTRSRTRGPSPRTSWGRP